MTNEAFVTSKTQPPSLSKDGAVAVASSKPVSAGAGPRAGWGMQRGESMIAGMALATLAILLASLAAAGWWAARSNQRAAEQARFEQVRAVVDMLSREAESLMSSGELTALRRALIEARTRNELAACRIRLPDGDVIADAEPSGITVASLPARWPAGPLDGQRSDNSTGSAAAGFVRSLMVPGRGPATLEVTASPFRAVTSSWEIIAGEGMLGVGALVLQWFFYRHFRRRVRAVGMIREALVAVARGERSADALTIDPGFGVEAGAWNMLLSERAAARREAVAAELQEKLDRRREPRGELELACESLSVGLAVIDDRGRVRHANGAAASLLRVKRDEVAGKALLELLPADEQATAAVASLREGQSSQRRTWEVKLEDVNAAGGAAASAAGIGGSGVLRVTLRPLRREDACAALLTLEDVTQQRVAEASRSAFVSQATHELRTPLTNMRLCIETALEEPEPDPAAVGQCLNFLNTEVRRLERMVGEMLSVAEIEAGSLKLRTDDVRLDALFDALRREVEPQASEKQIELAFDLPPKFPVIVGDRDKLVLALHNLIGNAIKYTPTGGKVTVSMRVDQRRVSVEVADTGMGVRPEEQEMIFERFYRARDPRVAKISGSGLGLALSREVARVHGGDVTVQSEVDKGSTFTLTVPLGKAA